MKTEQRNDKDRSQWIDNDEELYCWWKGTHLGKHEFIRQNRGRIDAVIDRVMSSKWPAHYLRYGH